MPKREIGVVESEKKNVAYTALLESGMEMSGGLCPVLSSLPLTVLDHLRKATKPKKKNLNECKKNQHWTYNNKVLSIFNLPLLSLVWKSHSTRSLSRAPQLNGGWLLIKRKMLFRLLW